MSETVRPSVVSCRRLVGFAGTVCRPCDSRDASTNQDTAQSTSQDNRENNRQDGTCQRSKHAPHYGSELYKSCTRLDNGIGAG